MAKAKMTILKRPKSNPEYARIKRKVSEKGLPGMVKAPTKKSNMGFG